MFAVFWTSIIFPVYRQPVNNNVSDQKIVNDLQNEIIIVKEEKQLS